MSEVAWCRVTCDIVLLRAFSASILKSLGFTVKKELNLCPSWRFDEPPVFSGASSMGPNEAPFGHALYCIRALIRN